MRAAEIIRKKRDGLELAPAEIEWMVRSIGGDATDYQWSALLMAIYWRGMTAAETAALTDAMTQSGTIVDFSTIAGSKIDKHSTGGVGDKTSLILAPIAAAVGVRVPMVSGRGLGHTGGTLDKLESIPGFRVDLDLNAFKSQVDRLGLALIGQTREIAPADKLLYALRDATSTVESIPLISASIMSKKLAEGISGLVLDVKTGNGAFMEKEADARLLAATMCTIGRSLGKSMRALLTRMDQPLGYACGNSIEVEESILCLKGEGPSDLMDLSIELAAEMALMGGVATTLEEARVKCWAVVHDGSALERFRAVIEAQGGDGRVLDDFSRLPVARLAIDVKAERSGIVRNVWARPIGVATMKLGAGRARVESVIDPAVGIVLAKKTGDEVVAGESLCIVKANDPSGLDDEILPLVLSAFEIGEAPVKAAPLVVDRL